MRRDFLRVAIYDNNYNVRSFAKKLGISRPFLCCVIAGTSHTSKELADRIAAEINIKPELLLKPQHHCPYCKKVMSKKVALEKKMEL